MMEMLCKRYGEIVERYPPPIFTGVWESSSELPKKDLARIVPFVAGLVTGRVKLIWSDRGELQK